MKTLFYTLAAAFALGFVACKSETKNTGTPAAASTTAPATATTTPPPAAEPSRKVTKMTAEGTLESVEDAGYPMAYISLAEEAAEGIAQYNFSQEDGNGLKIEKINPLVGKKVAIEYEHVEFLDAFDIMLNGKSILERPAGTACIKEIKGILDAPKVTESDLPSTYTIKASDGVVYSFETFITPAMVAAHGKEVSACLINASQDNLLSIKAK